MSSSAAARPEITLSELQQLIRRMYMEKDIARGIDGTFMWLMEEVGELAAVLRKGTLEERSAEFADVLAWLATIANVAGVDLTGRHSDQVWIRLSRLRAIRLRVPRRRETVTHKAAAAGRVGNAVRIHS